MEQIKIFSGDRCVSRILIDNDFSHLEEEISRCSKVFAVMDGSVAADCPVSQSLAELFSRKSVPGMLIEASEQSKTIETVLEICEWLLEQGADRDALVLAIGGGVTSDVVGFAAAIYKRGVRSAYVPTTLLSQVDASIGGKTGVNFKNYKNILGVIRQPEFVFLCPQMLKSLPRREFLSGGAELLKTFILADEESYEMAVKWLSGYARCESDEERSDYIDQCSKELVTLIHNAAKVKSEIVSRDQFEKGERRKLNLGHTFAHAIETLARRKGYDITHGEAVSMGILLAAELADKYKEEDMSNEPNRGLAVGLAQKLDGDFMSCGLPIACPFKVKDMAEIMRKDKKAVASEIHFILPFDVADVRDVKMTPEKAVELMAY